MVVLFSCDKAERNVGNKSDERFYYAVQGLKGGSVLQIVTQVGGLRACQLRLKHVWGLFCKLLCKVCLPIIPTVDDDDD